MRSTAIPLTQESDITPEGNRPTPAQLPKASYRQALVLYLVRPGGQAVTIRDATASDMVHLVEVLLRTIKSPLKDTGACRRELKDLDYSQPLDRWYCLNVLREYGACAPVFETESAARSSCATFVQDVTQV